MSLEEALDNFGIALGVLKQAFTEHYGENSNYVEVHINDDDYVTIYPSNASGSYFNVHRAWVDTNKE